MIKNVFPKIIISLVIVLWSYVVSGQDWRKSKWGPTDTIGAINEITDKEILGAAKLITKGKRYALGMVTGKDTPAWGTRSFALYTVPHGNGSGITYGHKTRVTANDDWALVWMGVGSQIDGLGHIGIDHVYYNGNSISDIYTPAGLKKLGIHEIPPVVTRGILLNAVEYYKNTKPSSLMELNGKKMLKADVSITSEDIKSMLNAQSLSVQKGDVVLIHTGFMEMGTVDKKKYFEELPGIDLSAATYLAQFNVTAVGSDTVCLEKFPGDFANGDAFPVHAELIPKHGIYILENMVTEELIADSVDKFMFVLGQARLEGAVQMIINPVAIR
ncbi:MAG: hypothetical protein CBC29_09945 [Methylococcaceae bacterium TMED69]|nr:MAG: hypothetical protein CBC29_09945 [Methylococcaceae bacterium TMED69]|tara:strand:+ start:598 stop:1584 length:987 start_codon:yes stop_codon:yes gene_type:complete